MCRQRLAERRVLLRLRRRLRRRLRHRTYRALAAKARALPNVRTECAPHPAHGSDEHRHTPHAVHRHCLHRHAQHLPRLVDLALSQPLTALLLLVLLRVATTPRRRIRRPCTAGGLHGRRWHLTLPRLLRSRRRLLGLLRLLVLRLLLAFDGGVLSTLALLRRRRFSPPCAHPAPPAQRRALLTMLRLDVRVQRRRRRHRLRLTEVEGVEQRRRSYSIPRFLVRAKRHKRLRRLHVPVL